MIVRAISANNKEVYFNVTNIIDIYQIEADIYNVYLVENKAVQINGETLRKIIRS